MKRTSKFIAAFIAVVMILTNLAIPNVFASSQTDLSYPAQTVKIMAYGGARALNITGYGDNSKLNTYHLNGTQNENWRIDYVSDGVYEIVNVAADRLVSLENNSATANTYCVLKTKSGDNTQRWRIEGVQKDFVGNYLYYKITNYANSNLALTWNTVTHEITVKNYTGANNQKWKLNLDGIEGFAGNCIVDEGEKASTIGGLLGKTVFVSTSAEFKENLAKTEPLTIVVTANISDMGTADKEFRIEDNKTVIGSYSKNTLHDPRLVTSDYWEEYETSHNIVLKNLTFSVETVEDRMAISVYGSKNIWIDHCTFTSKLGLYYDEVGKYIWVNEEASTGKNPDFVTISYNVFNRRYWGVAFGANKLGEDRASVMYNKFVSIVNRAPQLGNGKLHVVNNYYVIAEAALENDGYGSVKCGDGSEVYSDAQRFEGYKKEASGYWDNEFTTGSSNTLKDVGSYTDRGETPVSTPYPYAVPSGTTAPTWNPSSNYGYKVMSAYSTNDVKAFCNNHSGVATSFDDLKYINYTDCSQYVTKTVSNPVAFDYVDPSDEATETPKEPIEAVCDLEDGIYMIKNKYSGLYLEVADANASNGANVQQGSATFPGEGHNNWKIVSTGEGYYQFYPQIGDGNLALDVDYSNAADGTNVQIWNNDNSDGKFFKINKESDGTYAILTKASVDTSGLDVSEMSKEDGANVLQWTYSGKNNQKWIFEKVTQSSTDSDNNNNNNDNTTTPSYSSDTVKDGAVYMIKNVNSGLYLDVNQSLAQSGTNVQQWSATFPGSGNNNWKVVSTGDGYYQLYPQIGEGNLVLDVASANAADGTNVQIWGNDNSNGKYFKFQLNDDGTYSILTKASNGASCLDVYNLSTENGGNVVQWTYTGGANQKWILEMVREPGGTINGRYMEYLDRGVVAVRNGNSVFVSWRLLDSDDPMVGFNVYRTTDGVTTKLNTYPLYGGTNYTDTTADVSKNNTYFVKTVSDDVEESTAGDYTIPANSVSQAITIPIKAGGTIHFVWVGDFNADGKYDYLLDRVWDDTQKLEAYLHDGTYLWTIDMGYNSRDKDNQIEPAPAVIDVGMWDGATVYDIDCDGSAEVMLRVADGVVFGDGSTYTNSTTNGQAIAVINGMTGKLETSAPVPDDMISAGPKACMMEVGYLDGVKPSLVCWLKNRNDDKTFNSYMVAYSYVNGQFKQQWKFNNNKGYAEAHNIRIADVNYDGKDEVLHMGYALNGDGSLRYTVDNVVHGDRWYVGSFSNANNNNEMMGYGIQQDNPNGLLEYFYNASTGKLIWEHYAASGTADVARGNVGDVDPNYDGFECWSFQGLYSMNNEQIHTDSLYPVLRLWWDGDLLSESFNDGKIEEWDYNNKWTNRVMTTWNVTDCVRSDRGVPMFYGDILGDWREEIVMTSGDYSKLVILSTTIPTDYRLDCLAQNPCYRNCMTGKGYYQSHMLDYFLGSGMEFPNGGESDDNIYSTADFQSTSHGPMTNGVIEMDIMPIAVADNVIGITSSTSNPTWYDQMNIVINLAADGTMKAYNYGTLTSYETVPYQAGKKYHLYIETKVSDKTYSAWITDETGKKYTIALNYAYRDTSLEANDLGKLTLVGGWNVGGKLFAASNVQFYNTLKKEVTYILNDANGNEVERWTDGPRSVESGDVLYNFPTGEVYGEINNKAYILKSATDQVYTVADDNNDSHTVTLEIVRKNAVLTDTFADVEGNGNDSSTDMLFIGSAGVADAADTDADGNATVTGEGWNLSNPRVPLLTFNVPDDYENGKAVKLNVYVAKAHTHLGGGNSMKLAAGSVGEAVNENSGYYASNVANLSDIVWSDSMFRLAPNTDNVGEWVSIDVTEYVQNATGDTVTFTLYAPRAGAYIADRENASGGGAYMGKAAYLEVQDGETITTTGMEKVTKLGSTVKNPNSFVVPVNSTVKFYAPSNVGAYAVTNGEDIYTLTNNATAAINPVAGSYYLKKLEGDVIYSTAGVDEGFVTTSHGPITKGIIDMDFVPFASKDAVIAISSSTSNPTWFGQSNLQINFTPEGEIQAFNGAALDTTSAVEYEVGKKYHLHIETDVLADTYSAWITDEDGNEYTLALNYTYRVTGAEDLGKLLVIGGWNVEAGSLAVSNVQFKNAITKTVTYTINDADGVYKTWTVGPKQFALDEVLYDFPEGEFYYEMDGKAYILSSEAAQSYTVANDSNDVHNVTLTLVHENAVLADTFADSNANVQDEAAEMLFVGSADVSDAPDTDSNGNATVTGSGYNMGAPRIPVITFNVPENYEDGATVKLNVYVAKAHTHLGGGNSMKLAADNVNLVVNEVAGYDAETIADLSNLIWSDAMFRLPPNTENVGTWVSIDITEFVASATGDKVTFALYAPRAAAYVVDRENASNGGAYPGKAAYLEVTEVEKAVKSVIYTIKNADGVYETWTETYQNYKTGDVFYDFPAGEFYYERGGKAYIVKSETAQKYTVADDNAATLNVEFTLVQGNAVIADAFHDSSNAQPQNNTVDKLFIGSAGVSNLGDTDADNVRVTSQGEDHGNVGSARVPLITFNVPEVSDGKAVKLNLYVAEINGNLGIGGTMKLAANVSSIAANETTNAYVAGDLVNLDGIVWSDTMITQGSTETRTGVYNCDQWVSIDVTEFVKNATGTTITFALYAPTAGAYVVDREKAVAGGEYEGKAAYLEVVDAYTVEVAGASKVTRNGNLVDATDSVVAYEGAQIKLYETSADTPAFTNGTKVYATDNTTGETAYITVTGSDEYYAATVGVAPVDGAQVRIGDGVNESGKVDGTNSGLRFITTVDRDNSLANVEGATFGVRVTAEGSEEYVDIATANDKWQSETVFTSALTNLAVGNFNRKFTATPYVIADGQTFYGTSVTRSIYQVAAGLLVNDSTDGTDYDNEAIASSVLYNVLNAYVNQTGIRLSFTSAGLTEYTGTGTSAYSGSQFFEVVSAKTVSENVYTITIKPVGSKTTINDYWQEYIRINNNNSAIAAYTSMADNGDGTVTITFDYARYLAANDQ